MILKIRVEPNWAKISFFDMDFYIIIENEVE